MKDELDRLEAKRAAMNGSAAAGNQMTQDELDLDSVRTMRTAVNWLIILVVLGGLVFGATSMASGQAEGGAMIMISLFTGLIGMPLWNIQCRVAMATIASAAALQRLAKQ